MYWIVNKIGNRNRILEMGKVCLFSCLCNSLLTVIKFCMQHENVIDSAPIVRETNQK